MKLAAICCLALLQVGGEKQQKEMDSVSQEIDKEKVRKRAKFEPKDGEVLLFVGQELEAVGGLDEYSDGYLDHFDTPAGWTTYTNINPGENSFGRIMEGLDGLYETHDWGDNDYNATLQLNDPDYANMALAIGLQFVNHEEKVANGTHDEYINRLADFLLSLGKRPVFLRIAYEFDGEPWNHYDKESTIKAYKRIVDICRAKGVTNTAYVWQSTGFMSPNDGDLESWYPGDDYVDWLGFSFFNRWADQKMIPFARKKENPFLLRKPHPQFRTLMPRPQEIPWKRNWAILSRPWKLGKNGLSRFLRPSMIILTWLKRYIISIVIGIRTPCGMEIQRLRESMPDFN